MTPESRFRLPNEIPLDEYPKPQAFLDEARSLIDKAQAQGLILRVMGPIAALNRIPDRTQTRNL